MVTCSSTCVHIYTYTPCITYSSFEPTEIPRLSRIVRSGDATIVYWHDNTKTVVVRESGTPYNEYAAFCEAVVKKLYGSTQKAITLMQQHEDVYLRNKEKEAARAKEKQKRDQEVSAAREQILKEMYDASIRKEAYDGIAGKT